MNRKRMRMQLLSVSFILLSVFLLRPGLAWSEYPERPVTITVNMDPGGPADLLTRGMAVGAERYLQKPLIIDYKGGGGGTVALSVIATAKPDGYTLCSAQSVAIVDTPLMQKVPFKPLKSFTPVAVFANIEHTALAVRSDSPFKTFGDLRDYAKKNPGKIKYSTLGVGSGVHVPMEIIARKDGIKWVHVPYKGSVPATAALLGGHVDACSGTNQWFERARAGEVRPLATHGRARTAMFPDVPTLNELGYDFVMEVFQSIVGPAGLPDDVVKKLEIAIKKGIETPEFKATLDKLYIVSPHFMTSTEYDQYLKGDWGRTEKRFKEIGIIREAATQPY